MIVIDMDIPECWDDCRFNNGCECCLIDAVCTDETAEENGELPSFCPIKCDIEDIKKERYNNGFYNGYTKATEQANAVIEDIKAEIKSIQKEDMECDGCSDIGMVLDIIDKHTAKNEDKE